jgi:hypothetical protein
VANVPTAAPAPAVVTAAAVGSQSKPDSKAPAAGRKNSTGSDVDSDSFFDDVLFEKKNKPE